MRFSPSFFRSLLVTVSQYSSVGSAAPRVYNVYAIRTSRRTIDFRASVESGQARAHRFVVPYSAFRVRSAVARIDTPAVKTSSVRRTLRVRGTAGRHRRRHLARTASAAHVPAGTFANHRSYRQRIRHGTFCGPVTRFQGGARIFAHVVETGQQRRAVGVYFTFRRHFLSASHVRVAYQSRWTATQREMILHFAFGLRRTGAFVDTRVDALSLDARTVVRTVVMSLAFDYQAPVVWISSVAALAPTFRTAGHCETFGVRSARIFYYARVHTMTVDTRPAWLTFRVPLTSCDYIEKQYYILRMDFYRLKTIEISIINIPVLQAKFGFPSKPSKQEHIGWWFWTKHWEFVPQLQGLRHCRFWQASFVGQSSFVLQPGGDVTITGNKIRFFFLIFTFRNTRKYI